MKLSTESYKGVRDFYPEDQAIENYIFEVWSKTAESFGYSQYNASILEPTELYKAKSGEEIVNEQTYSFKDRGDRDVTLRPEMTPTVARMIAGKRRELKFPVRWYSIPNLFRYERPQRGRLREHFQLNCDIFGVPTIEAEVEMISLAYQIMKNFGLKDQQFEIRVGNKNIFFTDLKRYLEISEDEKIHTLIKLIDKQKKLTEETFKKEIYEILGEKTGQKFLDISFEKFQEIIKDNEDFKTITKIGSELKSLGIHIKFDQNLVRGFDYYTGTVFEIFDTNPTNPRALFGGGRYDNLLSIFGEEPVATVGFGMGDVTIKDVLETYNLIPASVSQSKTKILVCPFSKNNFNEAATLAQMFRAKNINTAINFSDKKIGDQIAKADKEKIPYVVIVGDDEEKNQVFKIKNLATKEEQTFTKENISSITL